ncbi:MAG: hypothetical protein M1823_000999 [Watsoniomyces obsoletus]|nr:MAG: hypothetical protein M1823_000999 [Watsoniomyces obsoletus]
MSSALPTSVGPRERSASMSSSSAGTVIGAQLTPRSKIQAMLAAIDDDSSEEGQAVRQQPDSPSRPRSGSGFLEDRAASVTQPASEDSEDDVQDTIVRPRGRMASRMQASALRAESQDTSEDDAGGVSAYARIKEQLRANQREEGKPDISAMEFSMAPGENENQTSSTVNAPRRRLVKPQAPRAETPKRTMRSSPPGSPGLFVSPGPSVARQRSSSRTLTGPSVPRQRSSSRTLTGPSVPRQRSSSRTLQASDSDLPEDLHSDPRFIASVAKERLAKAAETAKARKLQAQKEKGIRRSGRDSVEGDSDSAADQRLTQHVRPLRKASKKAQEEMRRETQRMARNMHLQHEARTKKRITKESLFERFNFKPAGSEVPALAPQPASSSTVVSDAEGHKSTEESSPPTSCVFSHTVGKPTQVMSEDITQSGEGAPVKKRTTETRYTYGGISSGEDRPSISQITTRPKRVINRAWLKQSILSKRQGESDSDVEIIPVSKAKAVLSEHLPMDKEEEAHSLLVLRACAQLNPSDDRPSKVKGSMTFGEMQAALKRRAREQGASERLEHLEELRKKGIVPQTAEERMKEEADIETLVEKARLEAEQLSKMEKGTAKKAKGFEDELDLPDDSTEDEEAGMYDDELEYEGEAELSGSDEEEGDVEELVDDEAADDGSDEEEGSARGDSIREVQDAGGDKDAMDEDEDDQKMPPPMPRRRQRRAGIIISDDEDDVMEAEPAVQVPESVKKPPTLLFPGMGAPMMSLSEIFAGTMAQTPATPSKASVRHGGQANLDFLRQVPALTAPSPSSHLHQPTQDIVRDSQPIKDSNDDEVLQGPQILPSPTQISNFPDPTQDIGFSSASPTPQRTIDTVLVEKSQRSPMKTASPAKKRGGRLQRRAKVMEAVSDGDDESAANEDQRAPKKKINAFDALFEGANEPVEAATFNKKKSRAKEMVDEQAEESEDEYAGLGGASDDGHSEDSDADMSDILNDEDVTDVREEDLVAFMADKDRAEDKRRIEQIYNDVTTGALRRKRGAGNNGGDYDLSDSDYDQEVRLRMKRREEAKLRRALLADENIEKIATNPKKSAFFRSIEDRDEHRSDDDDDEVEEEVIFVDESTQSQVPESQDKSSSHTITKPSNGLLKRKFGRDDSVDENRLPSHLRRQGKEKRIRSVSDIRETLADMIAPPNGVMPLGTLISDDDEEEMSEDDNLEDSDDDGSRRRRGSEQGMAAPLKTTKRRKLGEGVSNPFEIARKTLLSRSTSAMTTSTATTSTSTTAGETDQASTGIISVTESNATTTRLDQGRAEEEPQAKGKVIDRLSLLRQQRSLTSSSTRTNNSSSSRMAFHTASSSSSSPFMMKSGPMSRFISSTTFNTATTAASVSGITDGMNTSAVGAGATGAAGGAHKADGNGNGNSRGNGNTIGKRSGTTGMNGIVKVKGAKKSCSINWFNAAAANRRA